MDETPQSPPEASEKATPAKPERVQPRSRPGVYYFDAADDTFHELLGLIHVGENFWPEPSPEQQDVIDAMLKKGILRQG